MEKNPTILWVVALALRRPDGRWLMYRRPEDKHHGGLWEFPGGKVEPGETPEESLIREVREEMSLQIEEEDLTPTTFANGASDAHGNPIVILLYRASRWNGSIALPEGGAADWFYPEEIGRLDKPPLDIELSSRLFENQAT